LCSGFEIGFLSVNELKINALVNRKNKFAQITALLLNDKEKALTTLLIGNNIALVLMTFAFGAITMKFFSKGFPDTIENIILTIIVFATCELFPKSLFRIYSFELTNKLSFLIYAAYIILYPVSWFFMQISQKFNPKKGMEQKNYQLNEVAQEGARRRLLPLGVSILVNNFQNKKLRFCDICKNIRSTKYCGVKNFRINLTQSVDTLIESNILWNYDTVECTDAVNTVYYTTSAILDSFFLNLTKEKNVNKMPILSCHLIFYPLL
jgi:hypothetical protein